MDAGLLSPAMEDYLKTVFKLQGEDGRASTSAVADARGVSAASATNMLKRLAELRLVEYEPYRGVWLTEAGRRAALEIIRHHRLIELYLNQALGFSWDEVDAQAERMEHAISPAFAARIEQALDFPTHDPHGHPIPTRDLVLAPPSGGHSLADLPAGDSATVCVVDDSDPALLRYLAERQLVPGNRVEMIAVEPFDGPLTLRVAGCEYIIGREAARHVMVQSGEAAERQAG